jgi:uncharacterized damage-inducible protein DinB
VTENPYGKYVEGKDTVKCLEETPRLIEAAVRGWSSAAFERSYAPGKWSARQLLAHLAHAEMVFATRLRFALASDDYVVRPYDQDDWMEIEPHATADTALAAYLAMRRMTLAFCRTLTPEQRARPVMHPEHGRIDVEWIMAMFAGHERHHLPQLEQVRSSKLEVGSK